MAKDNLYLPPNWKTLRKSLNYDPAQLAPAGMLKAAGIADPKTDPKSAQERKDAERAMRGKLFSKWSMPVFGANTVGVERSPLRPSHRVLKYIARTCMLDQAIISSVITAVRRFAKVADVPGKQIGFRVVHRRSLDPSFNPDEEEDADIKRRCREMQERISNTTKLGDACPSFATFVSATLDDELMIDRKVMVKIPNSRGRPVSYHYLPGETVRPIIDAVRPWMDDWGSKDARFYDPKRTAERLSYELYSSGIRDTNGGIMDLAECDYVQMLDDQRIVGAWKAKDISVDIVRPYVALDQALYGFSPIEQSLDVSFLWMSAWAYQKQLFETSYPESILLLHGDYDEEGAEGFMQDVLENKGHSQRLPVIMGGPKGETDATLINLRNTPTDMLFDQLLKFMLDLKCAFFRVHPSMINFSSDSGGEGGMPQERNYVVQTANEEGVRSRMERLADWLTEQIIKPWYDDLVLVWEGLDMVPYDQLVQRQITLAEAGIITIDEARSNLELPKLPEAMPTTMGAFPPSQSVAAIVGLMQANKAMEAQQNGQMNPQGMSQPEGGGGGDFGGGQGLPDQSGAPPQPGADGGQQAPPPQGGQQPPAPQPPQAQPQQKSLSKSVRRRKRGTGNATILPTGYFSTPHDNDYMEDDDHDDDDDSDGDGDG